MVAVCVGCSASSVAGRAGDAFRPAMPSTMDSPYLELGLPDRRLKAVS